MIVFFKFQCELDTSELTFGVTKVDAICVLNKNVFLEKFIVLLWFMLIILACFSIGNLIANVAMYYFIPLRDKVILSVRTIQYH